MERAVSLIEKGKSFLFAADLDADSVGSMLSTALYLRLLGKQVYMVLAEGLGDNPDYPPTLLQTGLYGPCRRVGG